MGDRIKREIPRERSTTNSFLVDLSAEKTMPIQSLKISRRKKKKIVRALGVDTEEAARRRW